MRKRIWILCLGLLLTGHPDSLRADDVPVDPFAAPAAAGEEEEDSFEIIEDDGEEDPGLDEDEAPVDSESKPAKLSAEDEKALNEFAKKASESWLKKFEPELKGTIKKFEESNHLTKEETEKLDALTPAVIEEMTGEWLKKCVVWLSPYVMRESGADLLNQWKPDQMAMSGQSVISLSVLDMATWKEGLKKTLSAEKMAQVEEDTRVRRAKVLEEMKDSMAACEDQVKEFFNQTMETHSNRVTHNSGIDEARLKALKKAGEEAVKASLAAWRIKADGLVAEMTEMQLKALKKGISQRSNLLGLNTESVEGQPQEQAVWKDAVNTIVTEEERKAMAERRQQTRKRRSEALALLIVSEVDLQLGFSDKQRHTLVAAGARQMLSLPDYYFESGDPSRGYTSLSLAAMWAKLQKIDTKIVEKVLEPGQLERWQGLKPEMLSQNNYYRSVREPVDEKAPPPADEAEAEQLISDVLFKQSKPVRMRAAGTMQSKVEMISRVAAISPEGRATLLTAAKGATEWMAQKLFAQSEQYLRQQLQSATPSDLPARLANFSMPTFSQRGKEPEAPVWTAALKEVLDPAQQLAWREDCEKRASWHLRAISNMVLTEVEKQLALKPEQLSQLQKKIEAITKDYEQDINSYFSSGWHLQGYYNTVPLALIPEKEMTEILSKEEFDVVKERCLPNVTGCVDYLKQQHDRRLGIKTKPANADQ